MGFHFPFLPIDKPRRSKYGAIKETVDGVKFASKREAKRYKELMLLFRAGKIRNLELQPEFEFKIDGKLMFTYRADFAYFEGEQRVIEDSKGVRTPLYKLKKKIVEAAHHIEVREV